MKGTLTDRIAWTVGAILIAAYVAVFARLSPFLALEDFPNHLARAVVMADLIFGHGATFGEAFEYRFLAVPYVLGDLLLTVAVQLLGVRGATALWSALIFISLPSALLFYLRAARVPARILPLTLILSVYLATDWFFVVGFFEFRLAIAATLVVLAVAQLLRRRWSLPLYILFCALVVLGYLIHLTVIIFAATALGASALLRLGRGTTTLRRETILLTPLGVAFAFQFGVANHYRSPGDVVAEQYEWGTPYTKIRGLGAEFIRYHPIWDILMWGMLAACVLWPIRRNLSRSRLAEPGVVEMLAVAGAFLALYLVLPIAYADAYFVDIRALSLVTLFLMAACFSMLDPAPTARLAGAAIVLPLAALLAIANLAYLSRQMVNDGAWITSYRAVVAAVPRGAKVLPVYTQHKVGQVKPLLHVGSYVVMDRGAVIPYLFSGDNGSPMRYFRYVQRPYSPDEEWYNISPSPPVDWNAVACQYDFLLVTKPFLSDRIRVASTTVAENRAAALLAIPKQACASSRGGAPG